MFHLLPDLINSFGECSVIINKMNYVKIIIIWWNYAFSKALNPYSPLYLVAVSKKPDLHLKLSTFILCVQGQEFPGTLKEILSSVLLSRLPGATKHGNIQPAPLCSLTFFTGNSEGHSWGPCNTPSFDTPPVLEEPADRAGAGCSVQGRFKSNKNTIVCASSGSYLQAAALIILTARLGGTGGAILRPGIHKAPGAHRWIMHEGKAGVTVNCCDVIRHQ